MPSKKEEKKSWEDSDESVSEKGKSHDPYQKESDPTPGPTQDKELPLGNPVSDEKYKHLKETATKIKIPPNENAQADPSS